MNTLPIEFVKRLRQSYPDQADEILTSFTKPKRKAIRINTLIAKSADVLERLEESGVHCTPILAIPEAFFVDLSNGLVLSSLPLYHQGSFYIQSPSSMLASILTNPQHDELVLDACASPGSKTSHLAMLMGNSGTIVANDASRQRSQKLSHVLQEMYVTNVVQTTMPAEVLWRDYQDTFDRALADVPCTMEGRMDLSNPQTYEDWSLRKIKRLSTEQKGILRSVIRCVKPGGTIVYSTCTLAPEENEEVVDWILEKESGNLTIEPIELDSVPRLPILRQWNTRTYREEVQGCLRIAPTQEWEGFFVVKLKKR